MMEPYYLVDNEAYIGGKFATPGTFKQANYIALANEGLPRHPMYGLPPSPGHRVPPPLYGPDLSHVTSCFDLLSRTTVSGPPMVSGVDAPSPFRHHPHPHHVVCPPSGPYSPTISPTGVAAFGAGRPSLAWFPGPPPPPMPPLLAAAYGRSMSPPASSSHIDSSPDSADSLDGCRRPTSFRHDGVGHIRAIRSSTSSDGGGALCLQTSSERRKEYVKKPLNAFMLFMKECRQRVIEECTLKESAAINQILGRKWHALGRAEQAKYYEMARKEKELHMQIHPGWSARDNYATHTKKKKKTSQSHHQHQQQQQQHALPHHQHHPHHPHKKMRELSGAVNPHHEHARLFQQQANSPTSRVKDEPDRSHCRDRSPVRGFNHSLHSSRFKHNHSRGLFGCGPDHRDVTDAVRSENRTPVINDSRGTPSIVSATTTIVGHFGGGVRGVVGVAGALSSMSRSPAARSTSSSSRSRSASPRRRGAAAVVDYRRAPAGTGSVVNL